MKVDQFRKLATLINLSRGPLSCSFFRFALSLVACAVSLLTSRQFSQRHKLIYWLQIYCVNITGKFASSFIYARIKLPFNLGNYLSGESATQILKVWAPFDVRFWVPRNNELEDGWFVSVWQCGRVEWVIWISMLLGHVSSRFY